MFNFLPKTPFGMIGIVPEDLDAKSFPRLKDKLTTDGRFFYEAGRAISPPTTRPRSQSSSKAAARLSVRVTGDVAWSVVRLGPRHVRVTLIDSGYVDPRDRRAEVIAQHLEATRCIDVLRGQELPLRDGRVHITVPTGIFSIIDLEHRE